MPKKYFPAVLFCIIPFVPGCSSVSLGSQTPDGGNAANGAVLPEVTANPGVTAIPEADLTPVDRTIPSPTKLPEDFIDSLFIPMDAGQVKTKDLGIVQPTLPAWSYQSVEPSNPVVNTLGGMGDVTTYGGLDRTRVSQGGACGYGLTQIHSYAAINVNIASLPTADGKGQWKGGQICGQCARVWASTKTGMRETIIRITDKCPDPHCGMDLGGAPAADIMDDAAGRYRGGWEFVSCAGQSGVSDGPPSLHIKDGSGPGWAAVQIRNPDFPSTAISWQDTVTLASGEFPFSTTIPNHFLVPEEVLASPNPVQVTVAFSNGTKKQLVLSGEELGKQNEDYVFTQPPNQP